MAKARKVYSKADKAKVESEDMELQTKDQNKEGSVKGEKQPDNELVKRAYDNLLDIFTKHFENAMLEAGQYIIKEFYSNDYKNAEKKKADKNKSFETLNQMISENKKNNISGPSKSWIYNAVSLAVQNKKLHEFDPDTFHTYGNIPLSHKVLLLPVKKRNNDGKVDSDKTLERKYELIKKIDEDGLTVKQLRKEIHKDVQNWKKSVARFARFPKRLFSDEFEDEISLESLKGMDIKDLNIINKNAKKGMEKNKREIDKFQDMLNETKSHQEKYERLLTNIEQAIQKRTKTN